MDYLQHLRVLCLDVDGTLRQFLLALGHSDLALLVGVNTCLTVRYYPLTKELRKAKEDLACHKGDKQQPATGDSEVA